MNAKNLRLILFLGLMCILNNDLMGQLTLGSPTITESTCLSNGSITIDASGGDSSGDGYFFTITSPINYGPAQNSDKLSMTFLNLGPGLYTIMVTDNSNNTAQTEVEVPGTYKLPVLSLAGTAGSLCNTEIVASVANGLAPYTFSLYDEGNALVAEESNTNANNFTFSNLSNGEYTVKIVDACMNERTEQFIINTKNYSLGPLVGVTEYGCTESTIELQNFNIEGYDVQFPLTVTVTNADNSTTITTYTEFSDVRFIYTVDVNTIEVMVPNDFQSVLFEDACGKTFTSSIDLDNGDLSFQQFFKGDRKDANCQYYYRGAVTIAGTAIFDFSCASAEVCVTNDADPTQMRCSLFSDLLYTGAKQYIESFEILPFQEIYNTPVSNTVTLSLPCCSPEKNITYTGNFSNSSTEYQVAEAETQCLSNTASKYITVRGITDSGKLTFVSSTVSSFAMDAIDGGGTTDLAYSIGDEIPRVSNIDHPQSPFVITNLPVGDYVFEYSDDCTTTEQLTLSVTADDVAQYNYPYSLDVMGCPGSRTVTAGTEIIGNNPKGVRFVKYGIITIVNEAGETVQTLGEFEPLFSTEPYSFTSEDLEPGKYSIVWTFTHLDQTTPLFNYCPTDYKVDFEVPEYQKPDISGSIVYNCANSATATLSLNATGTSPLSYQVKPTGSPDSDYTTLQNSPVFTGLNISTPYTARVMDGCGNVNVQDFALSSKIPTPLITPVYDCQESTGTSGSVSLTAQLFEGLNYEWTKEGDPTVLSTERIFTISPLTDSELGMYQVRVFLSDENGATCLETFNTVDVPTNNCIDITPVKLTKFNANLYGNMQVRLNWESASEINFSHYVIERSADGIIFKSIGEVQSKKLNSSASYDFIDEGPSIGGINYYRLKSVDLDGSFEYSVIREIQLPTQGVDFSFSPNPAQSLGQLNILAGDNKVITSVEIFNTLGQLLVSKFLTTEQSDVQIKLPALSPDVYYVRINQGRMKALVVTD